MEYNFDFCFWLSSKSHLLLGAFILLLTGAYSGEIRNYFLRVLSLAGSRLATTDTRCRFSKRTSSEMYGLSATSILISVICDVTTPHKQDKLAVAEHKIKGGNGASSFSTSVSSSSNSRAGGCITRERTDNGLQPNITSMKRKERNTFFRRE
jgi:hypothetical protein